MRQVPSRARQGAPPRGQPLHHPRAPGVPGGSTSHPPPMRLPRRLWHHTQRMVRQGRNDRRPLPHRTPRPSGPRPEPRRPQARTRTVQAMSRRRDGPTNPRRLGRATRLNPEPRAQPAYHSAHIDGGRAPSGQVASTAGEGRRGSGGFKGSGLCAPCDIPTRARRFGRCCARRRGDQ